MSVSARHHRSGNYSFAVAIILFSFVLAVPGIVRGQPITEGFDAWPTKPVGWTFTGIADGDIYTAPGDYGIASPSIKLDATGDAIETQPLYRPDELSFWVKGMGTDTSSYLLVEEYYLNKASGWTEVTTVMPLPAVGTNFGGFQLEFLTTDLKFSYSQSLGDLAFDDVGITLADPTPSVAPSPSITPATPTPSATPVPTTTPTPPQDIPNPGFEEEPPLTGWTKVANKDTYVARSTEQVYEGTYSCTFSDTGFVTDKYADQGIRSGEVYSIIPGDEYDVSGWFYVGDKSGQITDNLFQFNIEWLSGNMVVSTDSYTDWSLNDFDTWEQKEYRLTAPSTADRARVYIAGREVINNNNLVYIDDFHLLHTPIFFVDSPAEGDSWYIGQTYTISWEAPHITTNIDIHYSTDGGSSWIPVVSALPDTGTYNWTVPNTPSTTARIRIQDTGGGGASGQSDLFRIADINTISLTSPIGGEVLYRTATYNIEWTRGPATTTAPVDLAYSVDNGSSWISIDSGVPIDPGSYAWIIPNENSVQCLVRIQQSGTGLQSVSPQVFSIVSPTFTVTYPKGGEYLYYGESKTITWVYTSGITGNVDIDYSLDGPAGPWYQITSNYPNTGSYSWLIPNVNTGQARIRISEVGGVSIPGVSPNDFTLKGLTSPQPYRQLKWREMPKIDTVCTLNSIEALDPNNIWVGCTCGTVYHWDGASWNLQESCWNSDNNIGTNANEFVAFAPNLVVGGGTGGVGVAYNGTCWSKVFEAEKTIYSIDGPDPSNILAGASSGTIVYKEPGTSWTISTIGQSGSLYGTVYLRPNEAYVVRNSSTTYGVTVFTTLGGGFDDWKVSYIDSGWKISNHPLGGCIDQNGNSLLWLVGDCGYLMHYDGNNWFTQTKSGFNNFKCVEVLDENNVWAFAEKTMFHYNGQEWLVEQNGLPAMKQLSAVSNRHVYGVTASKVYCTYSTQLSPTPYWVTPVDYKTPSPTPVPVSGPITGRVYDRITGVGVANAYVRVYPAESGLRMIGDMTDASGNYSIDGIGSPLEAGTYRVFAQGGQGSGIHTYRDQWYNQKNSQVQADLVASNSVGVDFPLYRVGNYPTPAPTTTPIFTQVRVESGDYSGDGLSDLAIFRPASGLWAIRDLTRTYFGQPADVPVSGDYSGDGMADIAVFRSASGLWAVRNITRAYFGQSGDIPAPGDYDGDGSADLAIFRPGSGLWSVSGLGRTYFGTAGDIPVAGDYTGDGFMDVAVFRPASGLWSVKDVTRVYFGGLGDTPVPGDYDGWGMFRPAIFRSSSGLWSVRGVTRAYFGNAGYQAVPGNFAISGLDQIGVFRPSTGLWVIQGLTRVYFGGYGDLPATR